VHVQTPPEEAQPLPTQGCFFLKCNSPAAVLAPQYAEQSNVVCEAAGIMPVSAKPTGHSNAVNLLDSRGRGGVK